MIRCNPGNYPLLNTGAVQSMSDIFPIYAVESFLEIDRERVGWKTELRALFENDSQDIDMVSVVGINEPVNSLEKILDSRHF